MEEKMSKTEEIKTLNSLLDSCDQEIIDLEKENKHLRTAISEKGHIISQKNRSLQEYDKRESKLTKSYYALEDVMFNLRYSRDNYAFWLCVSVLINIALITYAFTGLI